MYNISTDMDILPAQLAVIRKGILMNKTLANLIIELSKADTALVREIKNQLEELLSNRAIIPEQKASAPKENELKR